MSTDTLEHKRLAIRNARLEQERNPDMCSWCGEHLPEERHGTGACDETCAVLFQTEREGRNTCCTICDAEFTVSQMRRNASTCTPRCRKRKHTLERNT